MTGLIKINKALCVCKTHDTCNMSKHGIDILASFLLWISSLWIPAVVRIPLRGNVLCSFENTKDAVHIWKPLDPQTFCKQSEDSFRSLGILLHFSLCLIFISFFFQRHQPLSFAVSRVMEFQNSYPENVRPTKTQVLSYTSTSLHPFSPLYVLTVIYSSLWTNELCRMPLGNNITCIPAFSSSGSHKAGRRHVRQVFPPPSPPHPLWPNLA